MLFFTNNGKYTQTDTRRSTKDISRSESITTTDFWEPYFNNFNKINTFSGVNFAEKSPFLMDGFVFRVLIESDDVAVIIRIITTSFCFQTKPSVILKIIVQNYLNRKSITFQISTT